MKTIINMIKAIRDRGLGSIIALLNDHERRITTLENTPEQKRIITPGTPKQGA